MSLSKITIDIDKDIIQIIEWDENECMAGPVTDKDLTPELQEKVKELLELAGYKTNMNNPDNNISMPIYKHIKLCSTIPDINGMQVCEIGMEMIPTKKMREAAIQWLFDKYVTHFKEEGEIT